MNPLLKTFTPDKINVNFICKSKKIFSYYDFTLD